EVEGEEVEHIRVVEGLNVSLPCDVRAPHHDQPTLTLWYIADDEAPVYSYDERPAVRGSQWSDAGVLGSRAHYHPHRTPPALHLTHATPSDARLYRCRVDFKNTRSRVTWVNLTVIGSPPPEVTWLQGGREVDSSFTVNGEQAYNVLEAPAGRDDLSNPFVCRASNNDVVGPAEVTYLRNVTCAPLSVTIRGGELPVTEERPANLTCTVIGSNPPPRVTWLRHGQPLPRTQTQGQLVSHNLSGGVIVSQTTLAVQKAQRERSGEYKCSASNVEGDAMSNPLVISIKYAPRCTVSPSLRGAPLREPLNLTCRVDADPPDVQFTWTFNNSVRRDKVFGENRYTSHKLQSVLRYTPTSERDYGTLLCYARNTVGPQEVPCSFTVVSAGPPEEVGACGVDNITSHSVTVSCTAGFNGGLPQRFSIQVWAVSDVTGSPKLVSNMSEAAAEFLVRSLHPGQHYRAEVTAYNKRGTAQPVQVMIYTLKEAEMHKSLPSRSEPSAIMLVVAVLGGAVLVVVSCLMAGVWGVRGCRRAGCRREVMQGQEGEDVTTRVLVECNPDILALSKLHYHCHHALCPMKRRPQALPPLTPPWLWGESRETDGGAPYLILRHP
ncbi:hypothetical protein O3P69_012670, partial [Scylla paramamosain]